jgi:Ca2+-binding RTX toxin-like protein
MLPGPGSPQGFRTNLFNHRSAVNRRRPRDNPRGRRIRLATRRGAVRRLRWTGLSGAILAIVLAMPPMSAATSTVRIRPSDVSGVGLEIHYKAAPADINDLSISRAGDDFTFREDPGVNISPTAPDCTRPEPLNLQRAQCLAGVGRVFVELDDENDCLVVVDFDTGNDCLTVVDRATLPPPGESFVLKALGGAGGDKLAGGAGNDDLQGGLGDDLLRGGEGNDRLDFPDAMSDEQGADVLEGGPGDDDISGGTTALGSDVLSGGEGSDTADFSKRTERLTISLDGQPNDGEAGEDDNVQPDIECVIGGSGADELFGSSAADCLNGGGGEDTILGRDGDDLLEGGDDDSGDNLQGENGRDMLRGERGEDSLMGGEAEDKLMGGGGADELDGELGGDTLEGGPGGDALGGGEGDDSLYGGAVDRVVGADGDDRLDGGQGFDRLFGGKGNDLLDGGLGGDTMNGGDGKDTVTYDGRTTPVSVSLNGMADDGELGENDNVAEDVEAITGSEVDDTLFGDHNANSLDGGRGEDRLEAYDRRGRPDDGRDRLTAGTESDLLNAHDGNVDVVDCGDDEDLAIADRDDAVRNNCETVDRPGERQPIVGRFARVRRKGGYGLQLPQGSRFFSLTQNVKIPMGSKIDPKAHVVGLVTANRAGARQVTSVSDGPSVSDGRFAVRQRGRRSPVTELRLAGRLPDCRGSSPRGGRAKRAARPSARTLHVDVGGPVSAPRVSNGAGVSRRPKGRKQTVQVRGKNSLGSSHGTEWLTKDTCDGTLTKVISGTVRVRDFGLGRTCIVHAGESHLAAAPEIGVATLHQGFRGERAYAPSRMSGLERGEDRRDQRERSEQRYEDRGCRAPREPSNSGSGPHRRVGDPSASTVGTMLTVEAPKCVASAKTEAAPARLQRLRVRAGGGRAVGGCLVATALPLLRNGLQVSTRARAQSR